MKKAAIISIVVLLLIVVGAGLALSTTPVVTIDPAIKSVGESTRVKVHVANPHGVRRVYAWIEQNGKGFPLFEAKNPSRRFVFSGNEPPQEYSFVAGKSKAPELKEGKAKLFVHVQSNDLRASTVMPAVDVDVTLQPPAVSADGAQHYINQGGSELVTFNVSGSWTEAGVRVGKYTFRSFPMPGKDAGSGERFSLFAFPWDLPADTVPVVYARNGAGTEATARFWFKVFPKSFRKRELNLDDAFLNKVATELGANGQGSTLDKFLRVNGEMRRQNNKQLADLRLKTEEKMLWTGPFYRLGKVESFFADERSYVYQGKKVDQQMHLGFDLSDVQASPVKAANSGRVIHAGPLGIYGNCIVVDHGYGLQSIYGHLRQIDVKPGDMVQKEGVMGRSGSTGLAGGDHLHFSMQVDGVQVQPIEWWDEHWIKDRILSKLPAAPSK